MEYLKCFTVKDNIEEGIYVPDFESIIVEDPSTTSIKKATIEMVPVLQPESASTNNVTETSLVFLHEAAKGDKESADHVIIAVDPAKWKLCYSTDALSILDPCGLTGLLILLVNKAATHLLVKADDRSLSLQFDNKKLTVAKCGRAAMLRDAIVSRKLTAAVNMSPGQYRTTAPTSESESEH